MTAGAGGAAGGAAAAAAAAYAAEMMRREEEEMTQYTPEELREDWEFKILRAITGAFRKPEVLRSVCEEEGQAGWILVEKFDDSRLRFKRPHAAKSGDTSLLFDPYRTHYGMSLGRFVALVLIATFLGIAALIGIVIAVVSALDR